ncbi:MAG: tetratricopeptide repeat protein [Saprospiraceae bacterium]|nr:tetratricopeptide repeat protein [Saprospiraceae bacterium]MCF8248492.1 tetratricopeptide repeat protein [Saprospiraceae bacterium]MCF8280563.1 tetratricopeptide repeat protein [Bacteroidales bacterium]MCF8310226.1 tetratricopeptide repeat protein [Saprospiraceae bacterium]MCF8439335.1 tetratricopeptide repeat protein [Saprospiraceae bacterium]
MPKTISLFLSLFFLLPVQAKKHFEWTPALKEAYHKTLSLRFMEAEADLAKIRRTDPDNLLILHVENYLDFFHVYINEEVTEFKNLEKNKDRRLEIIEDEGDKTSPYYLFLQADILLHWALARLKFEEYSTAFFETNKAFKLLTANAEKFPKFMPNKKDLGILHAIVGTIPDNYKWTVNWLSSMEGSMEQGREELEEVLNFAKKQDFIYEDEIFVYYAYLMLHLENDNEEAWKIINNAKLNPADNPLACFVMANVAMRTDRGDEAINILLKRPTGKQFAPFYYLDYMLGLVKLQRLDDDANIYLQRYVDNYRGRNFIKDSYQKLAWHALLHGDPTGYNKFMNRCKSYGYTIVGSDKSALADAKSGDVPAIELLKARVLFDGGRFQRAFEVLKGKESSDYLSEKNRLEYNYRMGRITHKLGKHAEALSFYQKTIDMGRKSPYYFACRSALEKGHILEELGRSKQAKAAFNLCLDISPDDHKTALHQQAKAGLRRLK